MLQLKQRPKLYLHQDFTYVKIYVLGQDTNYAKKEPLILLGRKGTGDLRMCFPSLKNVLNAFYKKVYTQRCPSQPVPRCWRMLPNSKIKGLGGPCGCLVPSAPSNPQSERAGQEHSAAQMRLLAGVLLLLLGVPSGNVLGKALLGLPLFCAL